jgi:hypothetical protein
MEVKDLIKIIRKKPEFYLKKFLKIRTKKSQLVNFELNPAQLKSLERINEQKNANKPVRVIWLKARQLGISTLCEGLIFHDTANNEFRNSLIIAHEDKATQNLFSMSKLFYECLPAFLRPMKKYSNESALSFENPTNNDEEKYANPGLRSKVTVATAKNFQTARSNTYHNIHASEVAFWDNPEVLMTGLLQCMPNEPNTSVFIESTANGIGGWFYDLWKRSERGETEYIPIFLAWFDNPEYKREFLNEEEKKRFMQDVSYDKEATALIENFGLSYEQLFWRKWCINNNCNGSLDTFHQEYPSTPDEAFIVSGRPVFSVNVLKEYQDACIKPLYECYLEEVSGQPVVRQEKNAFIKIWREPEPGKFYVLGADVAEGLEHGDYSCGVVFDEDYNLCALWHGHIDPDLFGDELVKLGTFYNEAYLAIESNNHGYTTIRKVIAREYWNMFYQKTYNKINDTVTQKPGWATTRKTKPLAIDTLAQFIREKWIKIQSDLIISELFTYIRDANGSTNAQSGCNDDTVMASSIALQALLEGRSDTYEVEMTDKKTDKPKTQRAKDRDEDLEELGKRSKIEYTI